MRDKIKFAFIGLAAVIGVMSFFLLQSNQYLGKLKTERDILKESGNSLTARLAILDKENKQIKEEADIIKKSLEKMEIERAEAERVFKVLVEERDKLKIGLDARKSQVMKVMKVLKNENKFLKQQLKVIFGRKAKLEEEFSQLQDKNALLESSMIKLELLAKEKKIPVDGIRSEELSAQKNKAIELAPIVVRPEGGNYSKVSTERIASVLAVNQDNNFVIISIGESSGVKIGDTFQVFKKNEPIASIKIIQTRENVSAGDINKENMPIAVGDSVKL